MIKISIVVPVYNVERYLEQCLNSIYKLNLIDKEIILVNDGSTDNSLKILENYKEKYPENTKIITQINQGLAEARNTGIRNAYGEFILFIDSDDFIDPIVTENFLNEVYKQKVDILIGDYTEYFSDNELKKRNHYNLGDESTGLFFLEEGFKNKCFEVVVWKNIYRREFLLENNLFFKKGLLHEDNLFTPIVFYYAKRVKYFNGEEFYYYRQNNSSSIMKTKNKKNYEHMLYIINQLLEFVKENKINNKYFNRLILGIYITIVLEGKYKNKNVFKEIKKLNFNLREFFKLKFTIFYSMKCSELEVIEL